MEVTFTQIRKRFLSKLIPTISIILVVMTYGVIKNYKILKKENINVYTLSAKPISQIEFNKYTNLNLLQMKLMREMSYDYFSKEEFYTILIDRMNDGMCIANINTICFSNNKKKNQYVVSLTFNKILTDQEIIAKINKESVAYAQELVKEYKTEFDKIKLVFFYDNFQDHALQEAVKIYEMPINKFLPLRYSEKDIEIKIINYKSIFIIKLFLTMLISILSVSLYLIAPLALRSMFIKI